MKSLNPFRFAKYIMIRFNRLRGDPYSLARGVSLGIFLGVLPLMPIQTIILIPLTLFLRINTFAALIPAIAISNPLTILLQYYYCWTIGNMILPGRISWEQIRAIVAEITEGNLIEGISTLFNLGFSTISVLLVGGVIIAIPVAIIGYFTSLYFFITIRKKRAAKRKRRAGSVKK